MCASFIPTTPLRRLPSTVRQILRGNVQEKQVTVQGWVRSIRKMKSASFVMVTDGTSMSSIQVVLPPQMSSGIQLGSSVSFSGELVKSSGPGQLLELQADDVKILGPCDPETYPLQKKTQLPQYLREFPHLRLRTHTTLGIMRIRNSSLQAFHRYFGEQDFTQVQPAILTANDCEGSGEAFRVTTDPFLREALEPRPPNRGPAAKESAPNEGAISETPTRPASETSDLGHVRLPEFFNQPTYLTVSSQLHLEALAASLSRVYTISPTFRAEPSQTHRHLSEFTMLEAELAFCNDLEDIMSVVERSLKDVLRSLRLHSFAEVQYFRDLLQTRGTGTKSGPTKSGVAIPDLFSMYDDLSSPTNQWARMTYSEAMRELEKFVARKPRAFVHPVGQRFPLQSEHEKWLAGTLVGGPVFVTDYPASRKPFYMRSNEAGGARGVEGEPSVACFDLLVPTVGELVGGSLREERLDLLVAAMKAHDMGTEGMEWYLDLRRFGSFPHGGFGMGFERFISWITGIENIRDCLPFPRSIGKIML